MTNVNNFLPAEDTKKQILANVITINDFLPLDFVEHSKKRLLEILDDWWYVSLFPVDENNTKENIRNIPDLYMSEDFNIKNKYNLDHFNKGYFAYRFKRTIDNHYENCYCIQCEFKKYFHKDQIKNKLAALVGSEIKFEETFFSKYDFGDYLSIHHDKGKGDYAFVFQLTENWNPSFGALLHFYDSADKEVYKTINPKFNSLTIFKIKDVPITDHFVSMNNSCSSRYAFAGWFSILSN
jgi:Rps23 Pro-64 3,4-dihydroxylase Tpa1-like proline 4-hydroxylase